MADSAPTAVVERFIDHLRTVTDNDAAVGLLAEEVVYENSWMPTARGRERVRKLFQALIRIGTEVEMHVHAISADGPTVLTERTDVLQWGRLRVQFWICGRFDVHDGQIVLWREYYDPWPSSPQHCAACSAQSFPRRVRSLPPQPELLRTSPDPSLSCLTAGSLLTRRVSHDAEVGGANGNLRSMMEHDPPAIATLELNPDATAPTRNAQ